MKRLLARTYVAPVFRAVGTPLFWIARRPRMQPVALGIARVYAALVHWTFGVRRQQTAGELAEEWNRLMPEPRSAFPVVSVEGDAATAEIHFKCPLRGTGDAKACWRAMEFDRRLVARSGGRLDVIESQSVTGKDHCVVRITPDADAR